MDISHMYTGTLPLVTVTVTYSPTNSKVIFDYPLHHNYELDKDT